MYLVAIIQWLLFACVPFYALADDEDNWDGHDGRFPRHGCLSDKSAAKIVSIFEEFFVHIDINVADRFLTPDFHEYSDSINYVSPGSNLTPGAVTASSRAEFIQQQVTLQASPQPNLTTLAVYHNCDTITFRWHLDFPTIVAGIDVLVIKPGTHMIQTDYSEFNTVALLVNFGCRSTGGLCGAC